MAYTDYLKAQKLGEKAFRTCSSKGVYPYLPVLEDMLAQEKKNTQVKLGLVEIPIELIVGTYTSGRTTAFSNDFMPLLELNTEFSSKWSNLYDSLVEDGQRDPIIAYEYMNRFYVVEGNKRVSVLKFMGAASIEGNVTRIIPQKTDAKANIIYYEFLDFYEKTKVNYIVMNREGGYEKLMRHIHPNSQEEFTEEEQSDLKAAHSLFVKAYNEIGGDKIIASIGDAMLTYLEFFSYDELKTKSLDEIKKDIRKLWSEFLTLTEEKSVSVITDPTEASQKKAISIRLPGSQPLKAAFVYYKEPNLSGWSYFHEMGREYIGKVFGDKIQTKTYFTYDTADPGLLDRIIDDGYKVIFTTSPVLNGIGLNCAVRHPEAIILNCSLNYAYKHVRTYYLRIYEAKFVIGAVAGSMTETNRIGYIADYPIFGMPASINAFALGVKLVNPRAQVYLDWSTIKDHDPAEEMKKYGTDIISNRDISAPVNISRDFGLYGVNGDNRYNIAMPVWNWGVMYESLIRAIMNGNWKNDENLGGKQALNYYWGMSSDAIDVILSEKLPAGTKQLAGILKSQMASNILSPFSGEICDSEGIVRNKEDHSLSLEEIINMNWLADNVRGAIPDKSRLDESCLELIEHLGVKTE